MLQVTGNVAGTAQANSTTGIASVSFSLIVTDTDPFITKISVTIDWGDGQLEVLSQIDNPYGPATWTHAYSPGTYQIVVRAVNFKQPPQSALYQQKIVVTDPRVVEDTGTPVIYGPIIPRTQGYPSPDEWNYTLARDGTVLESSLMMLFSTACGERVYDLGYGSNLRRLIFSPDDTDLNARVRDEVARAVAKCEPRVELIAVSVNRARHGRTAKVQAEFRSLLSQQPIILNLSFAP